MNNPITHFRLNNQGSVRDQLNNAYGLLGRMEVLARDAIEKNTKGNSLAAARELERVVLEQLAEASEERRERLAAEARAEAEIAESRNMERQREAAREGWDKR